MLIAPDQHCSERDQSYRKRAWMGCRCSRDRAVGNNDLAPATHVSGLGTIPLPESSIKHASRQEHPACRSFVPRMSRLLYICVTATLPTTILPYPLLCPTAIRPLSQKRYQTPNLSPQKRVASAAATVISVHVTAASLAVVSIA